MQNEWHDVTFLIAQYHAWVSDPSVLNKFVISLEKIWVPQISIERQTNETLELFYHLTHSTMVAELARLPQYKTKEQSLHMLSYPLLMAADIIMSDCDAVIVWDDQTPHMQFYRDIAERNWYKVAETIKSDTPRIMSIKAPSNKMSKSLWDAHCIYLDDGAEALVEKVMGSPTDRTWLDNLLQISKLYWIEFEEDRAYLSKMKLIDAILKFNYSIWHKN